MAALSTHVLDTALGRPAGGVRVTLTTVEGAPLGEGTTDADGRVPELHVLGDAYAPRRLSFATRQAYALAELLVVGPVR